MSAAPITRRAVVAAAGAALGAAALPAGISRALAAGTPPTGLPEATPLVFDAAAFVADLRAAGLSVQAFRPCLQPGWDEGRPSYCIGPRADGTFGRPHREVMARWADAMDACPNHVERVVTHMFEVTGTSQVPT